MKVRHLRQFQDDCSFSVLLFHPPQYVTFCLVVQPGCLNTYYHVIVWPVGRKKGTSPFLEGHLVGVTHDTFA